MILRFRCASTGRLRGGPNNCASGNHTVLDKEMASHQANTLDREQPRRDEQAHKNGEAVRAGVEKLTDHRQRATADAWKSVEGSVDAASQSFRNASDQFARTLGYSGEGGKRLGRRSTQDVEAITKYGTVLAGAAQDSARQWYGLA